MSITRSVEFYCGKKNNLKRGIFGDKFFDYEFSIDIAYSKLDFDDVKKQMLEYMNIKHIKIGYCDVSADFGGGYSLFKRYTFVNKNGTIITRKKRYYY